MGRAADIAQTLRTAQKQLRIDSIDAQSEKLLQKSQDPVQKFSALKQTIEEKLAESEPTSRPSSFDGVHNVEESGYIAPQQEPDLEKVICCQKGNKKGRVKKVRKFSMCFLDFPSTSASNLIDI